MNRDVSRVPEWLMAYANARVPDEVPDRDYASLILASLDYESQLGAIRRLLTRNREADGFLASEIASYDEIARKSSGLANDHAIDEWLERMQASVYQDAAHSMAAVGMLAPFIESLFRQVFWGMQDAFALNDTHVSDHPRWQASSREQWDCSVVWENGKRRTDFAKGVMQLAEAVGLRPLLPQDLHQVLEAVFAYRNKMFHHGFEWPVDERQKFRERLKAWPTNWYSFSTSNDEPWVFYMTEKFIEHCLATIDRVLDAVGGFARDKLYTNGH